MRPEQSPDAVVTTVVPQVAPARRPPGRLRAFLPWAGVGLLAVVVLTGTTVWSAGLRPAASPAVPTLATDAIPTVAPAPATTPPDRPEPTSAAPRRSIPRAPVREAPAARPPAAPTTAVPTVVPTTTTVPPTPTRTRVRNPFGLGNEASCADPGAASRPECSNASLDGPDPAAG